MRASGCLVAVLTILAVGCETTRREQLEAVARDWCLSIRASQVVPVYPLTEDLQPGDIFLVRTTVHRQQELYGTKGFLPLDQHLARLSELDYPGFYRDAYWRGDYASVPHGRPKPVVTPSEGASGTSGSPAENQNSSGSRFPGASVPRAAFPSYGFEVRSGLGAGLAVPVQGVPLGLSLMGSNHAAGSITIADAFTYGIDTENLVALINEWSVGQIRDELARIARTSGTQVYLRVVTRVYLTGAVIVSMQNMEAQSAGLDAGARRDTPIQDLTSGDPARIKETTTAFREALAAISKTLNDGAPGASIRVASASKRSIALREDFDRPLVIGYLGFDLPVYKDGQLGPPVATRDVLEGIEDATPPATVVGSGLRTLSVITIKRNYLMLKGLAGSSGRAKSHADGLDKLAGEIVPRKYPVPIYAEGDEASLGHLHEAESEVLMGVEGFRRVTSYLLKLNESIEILKKFLRDAGPEIPKRKEYYEDMVKSKDLHESLYRSLRGNNVFRSAMGYASKLR